MTRDATTAFAHTLTDEFVRGGVRHAVIAPGSRSAPMALALARDGRLALHVVLDERAAGFVALGIGRATGVPAVVLTTSGTAGANLHPAVLEAHHGGVPLLVCTADRPPELRGVGAPQTIDQVDLFGSAVRVMIDAPVPEDRPAVGDAWRELAARAVATTQGLPPGPVHLNLPFREPLLPTGAPLVDAPGRADGVPWFTNAEDAPRADAATVARLVARVRSHPQGFLVLGDGAAMGTAAIDAFSAASGWPVIVDPTAGAGTARAQVRTIEALVRAGRAPGEPTTWVRVGAWPTSRIVGEWLDRTPGLLIDAAGRRRDPGGRAEEVVAVDPADLLVAIAGELTARDGDASWAAAWRAADQVAVAAIERTVAQWVECSEPRIARDVVGAAPGGSTVVVASSMPIRDVAWFATPRADVRIVANRGVNGIDGFVSTALGVAVGSEAPVVALCGDLSFLHDQGGLMTAAASGADLVIVVVDNDGGGIFSFLPQAELPEHFETLFATPPSADLAAIARTHGAKVVDVTEPAGVASAVLAAVAGGGLTVVRVATDRDRNVEHHRAVWDAVADALSSRATPGAPG